jgi:hypothetical protein
MTLGTEHASSADLELLRAQFGDGAAQDAAGWDAVHAFEARHGVVLPEPYRTFVAEITDGTSLGPTDYDGILPLGQLPADWPEELEERDLRAPFPLTERRIWEEDEEDDKEPDTDAVFLNGSVVLGTDGCGMNWHLVVTGEHRGHVWLVCGEGASPFGAEFGDTTGRSGFAGWVQHWAEGKPWCDTAEPKAESGGGERHS